MQEIEAKAARLRTVRKAKLPPSAVTILPSTGELVYINRDERGYRKFFDGKISGKVAGEIGDDINEHLGVTYAAREALYATSLHGLDHAHADVGHEDHKGADALRIKAHRLAEARVALVNEGKAKEDAQPQK